MYNYSRNCMNIHGYMKKWTKTPGKHFRMAKAIAYLYICALLLGCEPKPLNGDYRITHEHDLYSVEKYVVNEWLCIHEGVEFGIYNNLPDAKRQIKKLRAEEKHRVDSAFRHLTCIGFIKDEPGLGDYRIDVQINNLKDTIYVIQVYNVYEYWSSEDGFFLKIGSYEKLEDAIKRIIVLWRLEN